MGLKKTPLRINIRQNQNVSSRSYGHWFAEVDNLGWLSTKARCNHIAEHGRIWTEDIVRGVLSQLAECIPELVGQGYGVKLDGLGTFLPFAHSEGVTKEKLLSDGYNPVLYVKGVPLAESPMRNHPLTPMTKSRIADLMAPQGSHDSLELPPPQPLRDQELVAIVLQCLLPH